MCDIVLAVDQGSTWHIARVESTRDISWGRSPAHQAFTLKALTVRDPGWPGAAALLVEYEKTDTVGSESGPPETSREHNINLYVLREGKPPTLLALQLPADSLGVDLRADESFEITAKRPKLSEPMKRVVGRHGLPAPSL